jgi:hypothetical protein
MLLKAVGLKGHRRLLQHATDLSRREDESLPPDAQPQQKRALPVLATQPLEQPDARLLHAEPRGDRDHGRTTNDHALRENGSDDLQQNGQRFQQRRLGETTRIGASGGCGTPLRVVPCKRHQAISNRTKMNA